MKQSKTTPGPWELIKSYDKTRVTGIGSPSAEIEVCRFDTASVNRDDARLMAAAPEMLEALYTIEQKLAETTRDLRSDHEMGRIIRAAIAKAEGVQ